MLQTATKTAQRDKTGNAARALNCPATAALAACEPQGLDGAAVGLGGAMKPAVVTRRLKRSVPNVERAASRWRGYAFGALPGWYGVARAGGLRFILQDA